jgi:hypothetical protein
MTIEVREPVPLGDRPSPEDQDATKQPDEASISAACAAYVVLLITPRGKILRKPYLSLHSAQHALQRAQKRGQDAFLVLCKLMPAGIADLDLDGGDQL